MTRDLRWNEGLRFWRYQLVALSFARNQCRNSSLMAPFPTEIRAFARIFVERQGHRSQADYNPPFDFSQSDVSQIIEDAENAINELLSAPAVLRRAFAVAVLLRNRTS